MSNIESRIAAKPTAGALDRFTRSLDWNLLKYLVQIARSGSIGAAAAQLNISQPSVSTALRRLEANVGAQLFVRTRAGVRLTPAGALLVADAEAMVAMIGAKPAEIGGVTGALVGALPVATVSYVRVPALDRAVTGFRRWHPAIELQMSAGPWRQVVRAVVEGEAALGIGFEDAPRHGLVYDRLATQTVQLYCGPGHPLEGETITDLSMLVDAAFVAFGEGEPPAIARFRDRRGLGDRVSGIADSVYEAAWMIGLGLGIGFLPEAAVESGAGAGLWPLLPLPLAPKLDVMLISRDDLGDPAGRALLDAVREQIGAQPVRR